MFAEILKILKKPMTLVMIDRNVDWISTLITQLTYKGISDDLFGVENGILYILYQDLLLLNQMNQRLVMKFLNLKHLVLIKIRTNI